MTILEKLRADHREAIALLARILAAGDEQQRSVLFKQFVQEFIAQTKAEDKILYETLGTYEDARSVSLYAQQTRKLAMYLAENLTREEHKASELWTAQCRVLKMMLEQQSREEEDSVFPLAKEIFDEGTLRRMDAEFSQQERAYLR